VAADQHQLTNRAFFRARCPPDAVEVVREPASRSDVADSPHFSLALARADRSLLVLDTANGTRVEICRSCQETPDAGTCPTTVERQATGGLTVASRHDGARVLGARRNGAGLIDLLERDLATDCGSPWTVLGTAPDSAAAVQWELAMFGRKPGLLFSTATDVGLRSLESRSGHRAREPKRPSCGGRSKVGLVARAEGSALRWGRATAWAGAGRLPGGLPSRVDRGGLPREPLWWSPRVVILQEVVHTAYRK
jgi:hypothetical protein